jgi:hypothetical protein
MADAKYRAVTFLRVRMTGVEFDDVEISGEIRKLVINGVDVGPLIQAEFDRRYPDRVKTRPTTADGFREGWATIQQLWDTQLQRARTFSVEKLHESVDGEWSK